MTNTLLRIRPDVLKGATTEQLIEELDRRAAAGDPAILVPRGSNCANGQHHLCGGHIVRADFNGRCPCSCHRLR